ncbi:MAG: SDR family NAD(P)-dependent oxidoreductase [Solirubrobacteraceae bacterium]|nr:SDR family NAD(P)-dependent oxidoreductase [Solirubrobacteraceae bacterium]
MDPIAPARTLLGRSRTVPGAPRRVLITGAASGLGLALAEAWAQRGWNVLLTDRDEEALARETARLAAIEPRSTRGEEAAARLASKQGAGAPPEPRIASLTLDVTDEDDWLAARDWVNETWGGLDVLVNNAGVATGGRMELASMDDWRWVVDINLLGVVAGCRTFIPQFKAQGSGHIVNTASLAGLIVPPTMASYNVVKAGVVALSETLRWELMPYGISTTVVCPNFFKTNLAQNLRTTDASVERAMDKLVSKSTIPASVIAEQVVYGVDEGKYLVLTDRQGRIAWWVKRFVPPLYRQQVAKASRRLRDSAEKYDRQPTETKG